MKIDTGKQLEKIQNELQRIQNNSIALEKTDVNAEKQRQTNRFDFFFIFRMNSMLHLKR